MRRQIAVLLVGVFMVPQLVSGQTVVPGSRVRVSHPGEGTRTGTLVALTTDTLEVRLEGHADIAHLPLAQVTRLDVSRGKQSRALSYAGVGLVAGGGFGVVVGALTGASCGDEWGCPGAGGGAFIGGIGFGSIAGILGLIIGAVPTEKWEPVPPGRIAFVGPSGRHPGRVGLSLAF